MDRLTLYTNRFRAWMRREGLTPWTVWGMAYIAVIAVIEAAHHLT